MIRLFIRQHSWVPRHRNYLGKHQTKSKPNSLAVLNKSSYTLFLETLFFLPCCYGSCPQKTHRGFPRWQWGWRCKYSKVDYPSWQTCIFEDKISLPPVSDYLNESSHQITLKENVFLSKMMVRFSLPSRNRVPIEEFCFHRRIHQRRGLKGLNGLIPLLSSRVLEKIQYVVSSSKYMPLNLAAPFLPPLRPLASPCFFFSYLSNCWSRLIWTYL